MFKRGAIVLIPFPFTDLSANKVRPALIISKNRNRNDDIVVVFISSIVKGRIFNTDVKIKKDHKNFKKTGLKTDSMIKVDKIATLNKKIIIGELGVLNKQILKEVNKKLKHLFDF